MKKQRFINLTNVTELITDLDLLVPWGIPSAWHTVGIQMVNPGFEAR